jgi:hypothetical protein
VRIRALQCGDVEPEFAAPVVGAVPGERARAGIEARLEQRARRDCIEPASGAPGLRHQHLPEMIVEIEIEQRAVQVEQHVVDVGP